VSEGIGRRARGPELAIALVGGFLVSLLAGLFGVGGGVLLVPLLVLVLRIPQHVAHATSLVGVMFAAASGGLRFAIGDAVAWPGAFALIAGGVLGAQVGARFLPRLTARGLRRLFAVALLAVAARFLLGGVGEDAAHAVVTFDTGTLVAHGAVGLAIGIASAVLGVGGGVLLVPALVLAFGYDQHLAEGTSLIVVLPTALSGAIAHSRRGYTDWSLGAWLGVTGLVGGAVGASVALGLDPALLARLFGGLLAVIAGLMLWRS
jgi:uncharacterized protein